MIFFYQNEEYATFEELVAEANLIFNNAKLYNIEGSTIYMVSFLTLNIFGFYFLSNFSFFKERLQIATNRKF